MKRRIQLSTATMQSVVKIWPNKKVKLQDRLQNKCIVKSVLTYNICTWGLTKAQLAELDRAHRKQMRKVFNDPFKRNAHVYRDSNEKPQSIETKEKRWRAFGHILRLDNEASCQQAMVYYFDPPQDAKKYSG